MGRPGRARPEQIVLKASPVQAGFERVDDPAFWNLAPIPATVLNWRIRRSNPSLSPVTTFPGQSVLWGVGRELGMKKESADADAPFRDYVTARWPALVRTAYLLTGDQHLAEDLTQIALTKVYTSWRRVSKADNIDAYVRRVMVNANAGRFRKKRVPEHLSAAPPDADGHEPHAGLVERSVLMTELARLPAQQRAVVVLRFWEDMSEKQVASILNCSVGTVKSHTARALARLRTSPALDVVEAWEIREGKAEA